MKAKRTPLLTPQPGHHPSLGGPLKKGHSREACSFLSALQIIAGPLWSPPAKTRACCKCAPEQHICDPAVQSWQPRPHPEHPKRKGIPRPMRAAQATPPAPSEDLVLPSQPLRWEVAGPLRSIPRPPSRALCPDATPREYLVRREMVARPCLFTGHQQLTAALSWCPRQTDL